ncbi:golgin subfamily A member 1 isoform X2 [Cyclopterus lumpus]|uniref:golgin subfamily A member 1 isoform X2 n=1 Tax=Cyclopterus lumpus TaxID=8103 RepID=UPI001486FDA0|nr:golgin subfamily A member 1 isoform X2 [Cyclopterus lumpus]
MFAKLKKKLAEEAATAPRSGVRIPRTISKESITSVGADSGDDFASDGSSSRDDLPTQLLRRNDQIRKLEAKLSDYAEQLRIMQTTKEKLEIALEKHQDSSIKKLQDQNESHQASRAKMADGMALALEKKDQEWMEKVTDVEKLLKEEEQLSQRDLELQQKEAEIQSAKQGLLEAQGKLQTLEQQHEESCSLNSELEIEREELLLLREEAEQKINELQSVVQQVSEDFQKSQSMVLTLEKSLKELRTEHDALKLQQQKAAVTEVDKERSLLDLQKKVASLERRLQGNLSQDEHLQELLQEKSSLEKSLEETRAELLEVRTNHADTVSSLETQVSRMSCSITELQTLLRHKDDSSRAYKERTDTQIAHLEQNVVESGERLKSAEHQLTEKLQHVDKLQAEWSAEKAFLDQQVCLLEQQSQEKARRMEESITSLQTERQRLHGRLGDLDKQRDEVTSTLSQRTEELEQSRVELKSRQTVSTEIAKALEDSRRQKEELQTRVGELTSSLQTSQQELSTVTEKLALTGEDVKTLQNDVQCRQASLVQLQEKGEQMELDKESQLSRLREELLSQTQQLDSCQARISYLEVEVETLTEQLHTPEVCEEDQNGSVTVDDLDHIQKVNRELEQQLSDKNRIIKQLQQRLAELKRTLQKELKLKPESEAEGKEKFPENRERVFPDPLPASTMGPPTSNTLVTNTSDLNDSREINFEYLKHVVLKFMSSREAEAFQLIRAVSVLLNFTREEEDMLKQTLEYKMSWFGSKPSPKGTIRPSVSGTSPQWS